MEFITDRTRQDAEAGIPKGCYGAPDLNRVEENTGILWKMIREMGENCPPILTKTDWDLPGNFSAEEWPVKEQMERYLGNVRQISTGYGLNPVLPQSLEHLTWEGANQIEKALADLDQLIQNTRSAAPVCGGAETGGLTG